MDFVRITFHFNIQSGLTFQCLHFWAPKVQKKYVNIGMPRALLLTLEVLGLEKSAQLETQASRCMNWPLCLYCLLGIFMVRRDIQTSTPLLYNYGGFQIFVLRRKKTIKYGGQLNIKFGIRCLCQNFCNQLSDLA